MIEKITDGSSSPTTTFNLETKSAVGTHLVFLIVVTDVLICGANDASKGCGVLSANT